MLDLSPLGDIHTAAGIAALAAGFWILGRDKEISPRTRLGQLYVASAFLSAATALGIYRHGGFGPAHLLAVLTIAALLVGTVCAFTTLFGTASRYLQAGCLSATILFGLLPGLTETLMRFPPSAPLVPLAEVAKLKPLYAALFLLYLFGLGFQLRWIRRHPRA